MRQKILLLLLISVSLPFYVFAQSSIPDGYKLVYSQDFESPQAIRDFEMSDERAWRIGEGATGKTLELFGKSEYEARVRSPFNIALLKDVVVGDFVLEANLSQTGREYGHRDLCLFFGVNTPTNFYYVHIASVADNNANNIFLVNDEPRTNIATKTTKGTDWGKTNSWHTVRIERKVAEGTIKIYFDDMTTPIMETTDTHFDKGRIGLGSFDDTGQFDNLKIWAPTLAKKKVGFFR
ncbi:MAG: hypothetical protein R3B93_10985 [Bacteroidia bacterium]